MKKILILLWISLCAFQSIAQKIDIDNQGFPNIKAKIISEKPITQENTKITQNSQAINFIIAKDSNSQAGTKAIYFLVETSGFTSSQVVTHFKSGVSDFIKSTPEGTLFNASSFWKANSDSKILNNWSADFTNNKELFVSEFNQKIKPVKDTIKQADIHKAIYDAIEYVSQSTNEPEKIIVVLTAGVNKSYSNFKIEDCIDKANSSKIKVYSLVYKTGFPYALDNLKKLADKTNAQSEMVSGSSEITEKLNSFIDSSEKPSSGTYEVSFTLPNPENLEGIQISIDGKSQNITITKPEGSKESSKNNNLILYIAIGFVVMAGFVFVFIQRNQKAKKRQQEEQEALKKQMEQQKQQFLQEQQVLQQQLQNQQSIQQPTSIKEEPKKFDPKKTYIGVGGGTPTLSVSGQGINKTFELHKPTMTIGRKEDNDIIIPVQTVSGSHAILSNEGGNWFITDNGSTNGVIVNGNKVDKHILKQGDKIQLGGALMTFNL
ncbi:MAG: FHA domain-containing protein [Raineya sp.]|jgi:pSer/pThr/pTyr-binding forkhead associated (FHA) protein|nr:FHA domain-containing protein [Raineya sp.]